MRFAVEITEGAEADLKAIHRFMCEVRGADDVDVLLDRLIEKIKLLEEFPLRGNVPKELDGLGINDVRQTLLYPHRLIYRVLGSTVYILVIADGRRDFQALLERRILGRL